MLDESKLDLIRQYQAKTKACDSVVNAAVSLVMRDTNAGPEFLLMQRAKHDQDPWSGQMALPGGKFEEQDKTHRCTAIRETKEEVGIELRDDEYIGQLDDIYGVKANGLISVHVACFVFKVDREVKLKANYEVGDMLWLPLEYLNDIQNSYDYYHPNDATLKMPAVLISEEKEQILWGLTLRLLVNLFRVLKQPMSALSKDDLVLLDQLERLAPPTKKPTA